MMLPSLSWNQTIRPSHNLSTWKARARFRSPAGTSACTSLLDSIRHPSPDEEPVSRRYADPRSGARCGCPPVDGVVVAYSGRGVTVRVDDVRSLNIFDGLTDNQLGSW